MLCRAGPTKRQPGRASLIGVVLGLLAPISFNVHFYMEREWFAKSGIHQFESVLKDIENGGAVVSSNRIEIQPMVFAQKDENNCLCVWFYGRAGRGRSGYLYYAGTNMVRFNDDKNVFLIPRHPNNYYHHITNDWFYF